VRRAFGFQKLQRKMFKSRIHDREVLLAISGVGREAARQASEDLWALGAKALVSMGFCGALVPELNVGDLVTHRIATIDKPLKTPDERRALTARANAVAVDMETQAIIEVGTRRGVPIHVLRVVSDAYHDDLTPLFGKDSTFHAWRLALRLCNPRTWPLAWRLRKQSRTAGQQLVKSLAHFLQSSQSDREI
jgi:nucleoside phosphorylase